MGRFIIRRLIGMIAVLFAISVLVFLIFNVIPNSDPALRIGGKNANQQLIDRINKDWGFNDPLPGAIEALFGLMDRLEKMQHDLKEHRK